MGVFRFREKDEARGASMANIEKEALKEEADQKARAEHFITFPLLQHPVLDNMSNFWYPTTSLDQHLMYHSNLVTITHLLMKQLGEKSVLLQVAESRIVSSTEKVEGLEILVGRQKREKSRMADTIESLKSELKTVKEEKAKLMEENKKLVNELEVSRNEEKTTKEKLLTTETELKNAKTQVQQLSSEATEAKKEVSSTKSELSKAKTQIEELRAGWKLLHPSNPIVFFKISIGGAPVGRIIMELFAHATPRTAENFRALCTGEKGKAVSGKPRHYKGSRFFMNYARYYCIGGDFIDGTGRNSESSDGGKFATETFRDSHESGDLAMWNGGQVSNNGSQFVICYPGISWVAGSYGVFGRVVEGMDVLGEIEKVASGGTSSKEVIILDCGQLFY